MEPEQIQQTPDHPTPEGGALNELEALRTQLAEAQAAATQAQALALEAQRGRLLAEHAGTIVPELVTGSTPEELAASIETAKGAYHTIANQVRASLQASAPAQLPNVGQASAGGGASQKAPEVSVEGLSPMQKIQHAFASRNGRHSGR
jgi:hypothetical protein